MSSSWMRDGRATATLRGRAREPAGSMGCVERFLHRNGRLFVGASAVGPPR